jgi:hypothetical protein
MPAIDGNNETNASSPGIRLKQTQRWDKEFAGLAGLLLLVFLPVIGGGMVLGEWGVLFLAALPAAVVAVGRCFQYCTSEDYVVLFADRMEFPRRHGEPRVIAWSHVRSLRWRQRRDSDSEIVISVTASSDWPLAIATIGLRYVSPTDRVTLIRYLRLGGQELEQQGWRGFCRKQAVPLVETLQRSRDGKVRAVPETAIASRLEEWSRCFDKYPFVGGVILPVVALTLFPRFVSRKMWWSLAAIVAISGVVNIRVVWGHWASPFTEIVLGTAVVSFCLGLVARVERDPERHAEVIPARVVILSLAVTLIGCPLLLNAKVLGWVRIPRGLDSWLPAAFLLTLWFPVLFHVVRRHHHEKQESSALEAEALRRWDIYMETGELPDVSAHKDTYADPG